jgi:hypothetical protein
MLLPLASKESVSNAVGQGREHDDAAAVHRARQLRQPRANARPSEHNFGRSNPSEHCCPASGDQYSRICGDRWQWYDKLRRHCADLIRRRDASRRLACGEQLIDNPLCIRCRHCNLGRRINPDYSRCSLRNAFGIQAGRRRPTAISAVSPHSSAMISRGSPMPPARRKTVRGPAAVFTLFRTVPWAVLPFIRVHPPVSRHWLWSERARHPVRDRPAIQHQR